MIVFVMLAVESYCCELQLFENDSRCGRASERQFAIDCQPWLAHIIVKMYSFSCASRRDICCDRPVRVQDDIINRFVNQGQILQNSLAQLDEMFLVGCMFFEIRFYGCEVSYICFTQALTPRCLCCISRHSQLTVIPSMGRNPISSRR